MTPTLLLPPLSIAAKNCRLVQALSDQKAGLWSADLKLVRHRTRCAVFENVLFMLSDELCYISGIENEDGLPRGLPAPQAQAQQHFIRHLQMETACAVQSLANAGLAEALVYPYDCVAQATAAFLIAHGTTPYIGYGMHDEHGQYQIFAIDGERDGYFEDARNILPFDALEPC